MVVRVDEGVGFAHEAGPCVAHGLVALVDGGLGGLVYVGFLAWASVGCGVSMVVWCWEEGCWGEGLGKEVRKRDVHLAQLLHGADLLSLAGGAVDGFFASVDVILYGDASGGALAVGPLLVGVAVALEWLGCGADVALLDRGGG